jgi:hypothetical protein
MTLGRIADHKCQRRKMGARSERTISHAAMNARMRRRQPKRACPTALDELASIATGDRPTPTIHELGEPDGRRPNFTPAGIL